MGICVHYRTCSDSILSLSALFDHFFHVYLLYTSVLQSCVNEGHLCHEGEPYVRAISEPMDLVAIAVLGKKIDPTYVGSPCGHSKSPTHFV